MPAVATSHLLSHHPKLNLYSIILLSLLLLVAVFQEVSPTKIPNIFRVSPFTVACPPHHNFLVFTVVTVLLYMDHDIPHYITPQAVGPYTSLNHFSKHS
jgi:hypothetical protein